ncbi:hypothetical protein PHLCEN_2v666 [Hermanssonia centrifuga]|uniref:Xylose isomerase n=1 Tax=Hermanssonia centrifuga TaxID=98765 RepID=A0A2R6S5G5_9APHY|nr:hypothetical protein PHLCEN_2v666 [Hermanssonia centrifuga]
MREHKLRTAYSTDSAGMHPNHTLPLKLRAIAEAGFSDAELAFPDLEAYASQEYPGYRQLDRAGKGDMDTLCKAAGKIRKLCDELDLGILAVHPFDNYEGFKEKAKIDERLERAAAWFKVMKEQVLECEMLQVGSSIDPTSSGDFDIIASNFQQLADKAAAQIPPIRM